MKRHILTLAALLSFSVLPTVAQEDVPAEADETSTLSPEELKEQKKAAREAKKKAALVKARAKLKFKWYKSLKSALKAARKYNCTCVVLYTDPSFCHFCVKLDKEVFESKEFKAAKGIGVGFRSTSPINEYGLSNGMPKGVVVGPDGKAIRPFGYSSGVGGKAFADLLKGLQPVMEMPVEDEEAADE